MFVLFFFVNEFAWKLSESRMRQCMFEKEVYSSWLMLRGWEFIRLFNVSFLKISNEGAQHAIVAAEQSVLKLALRVDEITAVNDVKCVEKCIWVGEVKLLLWREHVFFEAAYQRLDKNRVLTIWYWEGT